MRFVETERRNGVVWLWLNRPERHNALIPALVADLRTAIAAAVETEPEALVLSGRGASFSTGGDVAGFLDHASSRDELMTYSDGLVSELHEAILDLLAFPAPVLAAVNGPVTGGSTGLMLAADLVAMSERAFLQPYYSEVGFGPDGGWTALLPERIGTSRALQVQYLNERISAAEALELELAASVCPAPALESQIEVWTNAMSERFAQSHRAIRANVWDDLRRETVRFRLAQEKDRFLELIAKPGTLEGMRNFTRKRA